jgi:hypothetical protein
VHGAKEALRLAVVAERAARGLEPARQSRVRHGAAVPDFLDDLVLGDDALAVLDEQVQQREDLRLDLDDLAAASQLRGGRVQLEVAKSPDHARRR